MDQHNTPQPLSEERNRYEAAKQLVNLALTTLPPGEEREAELQNAIRMLEKVAEEERTALLAEVERLKANETANKRKLSVDWMEAAEIEHRRVLELESQDADMRDAMRDVAAELEHMADALDIDMPSDSGYVQRVQKLARTLRTESEGSTDA